MKKKKTKILLPRIPRSVWESYRKRGGLHGTKKGERGYVRRKAKSLEPPQF